MPPAAPPRQGRRLTAPGNPRADKATRRQPLRSDLTGCHLEETDHSPPGAPALAVPGSPALPDSPSSTSEHRGQCKPRELGLEHLLPDSRVGTGEPGVQMAQVPPLIPAGLTRPFLVAEVPGDFLLGIC